MNTGRAVTIRVRGEINGKLGERSAATEGGERAGPKTARTTRPSTASPWRSQRIASKREPWPEQEAENNAGRRPQENRCRPACAMGQVEGW
jgi:hypothetical protein